MCNCHFNCYSVSIFPSASLDPLVTLIPLYLSHPCRISHTNSLVSSVLSALLTQWFIPSPASMPVRSWPQHFSKVTIKMCFLPSQHLSLKAPFHGYQAQTRASDLGTGSLYLQRMRNRSRKVSPSLSLHSSFPWFSSLQPLNQLMSGCSITIHTQSHLDTRGRQGAQSWNFTPVVCTLQKGTVARGKKQLGLLTDSVGKHYEKHLTLKNLQFFSSQTWKEDSTNITEDKQGS